MNQDFEFNILITEADVLVYLCKCMYYNYRVVMERFGGIVGVCVESLHDLCRIEGDCQTE